MPATDTPSPPVPVVNRRSFLKRFFQGLHATLRGASYLARHPSLWPYALLPTLINLFITALLLVGILIALGYFLPWMYSWSFFSTGAWWGPTQKVAATLAALAAALALVAGFYLLLAGILTAFFFEALARRIELDLGTPESLLVNVPFRIQVADALLAFAIVLPVTLLCFLLNCIPVVGTFVGGAISLYVDANALGFAMFDIPLSLRGLRLKRKRAYLRQYRPETLGIGTSVLLFALVPILGSIMITAAATGAVLFHHDHPAPS